VAAGITPAAAAHLQLAPGQPVWVAVKATETRAYLADISVPPETPPAR
jgi:molybdate transport system ATP-binding protein